MMSIRLFVGQKYSWVSKPNPNWHVGGVKTDLIWFPKVTDYILCLHFPGGGSDGFGIENRHKTELAYILFFMCKYVIVSDELKKSYWEKNVSILMSYLMQ